jgi:hypothetical protein
MVEEPQVIVHAADQPDFFVDLFHADVLAGEDSREVDPARGEADAATHGDDHGAIVERKFQRIEVVIARVDIARPDSASRSPGAAARGCSTR